MPDGAEHRPARTPFFCSPLPERDGVREEKPNATRNLGDEPEDVPLG